MDRNVLILKPISVRKDEHRTLTAVLLSVCFGAGPHWQLKLDNHTKFIKIHTIACSCKDSLKKDMILDLCLYQWFCLKSLVFFKEKKKCPSDCFHWSLVFSKCSLLKTSDISTRNKKYIFTESSWSKRIREHEVTWRFCGSKKVYLH